MKSIQFQHGDREFSLVLTPQKDKTALEGVVCASGGAELFRIRYAIAPDLQKKWKLDDEMSAHFLGRFAQFHAQVRAAKGDLTGKDEYLFDADFSAVQPSAVVQKVEKEWQNLKG
jgi:hypothetical protein